MNIKVVKTKPRDVVCDLIVLVMFNDGRKSRIMADIDKSVGGLMSQFLTLEEWKGELGKSLMFYTQKRIFAKKILLLGAGPVSGFNLETLRIIGGHCVKKSKENNTKNVAFVLDVEMLKKFNRSELIAALSDGVLLGDYRFLKYKQAELKKEKVVDELNIIVDQKANVSVLQCAVNVSKVFCDATNFIRDLVNEPACVATPVYLVNVAKGLESPYVNVQVFDKEKIVEMKMGGVLGVSRGSDEPPYFVHLTYKPRSSKKLKKIALIGKGITFDSGGLSLKGADHLETMKLDMAGAATVLGVFKALSIIKPMVEVHGIMALCENMPSGKATKPGDVVTTMNGKTIEILNTDAEGRIILADSLEYAQGVKPDYIVDLATLTGACAVALGDQIAGMMGNSRKLIDMLKKAAVSSGEKCWELPLVEEYRSLIKSDIADVKNIAKTRYGGAITAGLFLEEFVHKIPWVHLDIAGPAYAEKDSASYVSKGGTVFGVRMILTWLVNSN
jgi:leucyl aminopeptidase